MDQSIFPRDPFKAWQVAVRPGKWEIEEGGKTSWWAGPCLSRPLPVDEAQKVEVDDLGGLAVQDHRFPPGSWFMCWAALFVPNHANFESTLLLPGSDVQAPVSLKVSKKCITPAGVADFDTLWTDWLEIARGQDPETGAFTAKVEVS